MLYKILTAANVSTSCLVYEIQMKLKVIAIAITFIVFN